MKNTIKKVARRLSRERAGIDRVGGKLTVRIGDGDGRRARARPRLPRVQRAVAVGADELLALRVPRDGAQRLAADEA